MGSPNVTGNSSNAYCTVGFEKKNNSPDIMRDRLMRPNYPNSERLPRCEDCPKKYRDIEISEESVGFFCECEFIIDEELKLFAK